MRNDEHVSVTVAICTYNRADCIQGCLAALFRQKAMSAFEVLVVDNNSTDGTRDVVEEMRAQHINLHYVLEPKQGLSHARNGALRRAIGDIVAFIDDDGLAEQDWLANLTGALADSDVACAGGRIEIDYGGERPEWLPEALEGYLSKWDGGENPDCSTEVVGCNFAVRKKLAIQLGSFSPSLGYARGNQLPGEESEFCVRVRKAGLAIRYVGSAVVYHRIVPERLTPGWFVRRAYMGGRATAIIFPELEEQQDWLGHVVYTALLGYGSRLRQHRKNALVYRCQSAYYSGLFAEFNSGKCISTRTLASRLGLLRTAVWPGLRQIIRSREL